MMNSVLRPNTENICMYTHLDAGKVPNQEREVWTTSLANEFGRLADRIKTWIASGINPIKFITNTAVPRNKDVTYVKIIYDMCTHTQETYHCQLTVGGNKLDYQDVSAPTSDLTTEKYIVNSPIYKKNERHRC